MPWKSDGDGPFGGGGGQGPWGGNRPGGGGGGGGQQPPDIDELLRRGQDKFKGLIPTSGGGGRGLFIVAILAIVVWLGSGFYRVQPGEQGVELLFGKFVKLTSPGLNYWAPTPFGDAIKVPVTQINTVQVGFRGNVGDDGRAVVARDVPQESLMLTSDQNIIDMDFVVQWRIKDAAEFLFNISNQENTIKAAAESAMREVIGQSKLEAVLTSKRQQVQEETRRLVQAILDDYGAGVSIESVQLQNIDPPKEVIDAFNDVQRAKQDQERSINEATAYRNNIVPRAKGQAEKMVQDASAYKEKVIKEADGEAKRFLSVYETYKDAKDVTRLRLYLERMQSILKSSNKMIIDQEGGSGVVPYLPLNELQKSTKGATQ
ncbi:MAG: FtsH protease activity modulator HflK [Rhodospirillales bacterium]|jgi:modulator of FtsH protease HflK|nr:FtsH protease activity modulator HflK [Rhodospirillales bacterium]MBT4627720.1 FtsH protease activity modulator HflK [Rhodospirillales bacterium]MBT5352280.1 FtsH protease activity modulator HflK [Rhodospirillales bacterium]MBT5521071.1 FtsH protease activity modulator HflK [Rhodospirillales bacterium]MBT6109703.1 FtsH protease activity modulator HflK [Rhodospirillales bacterium]